MGILALALDPASEPHVPHGQMSVEYGDLAALQERIGYRFSDPAMLSRALTHVSALPASQAQRRVESYQRLEFLGDRVLGLAVAEMLFENFPGAEEGELSRRLADLVRKETCADLARDWGCLR